MYQDIFFDLKSKKVHIWDDKRGYQSKVYKPYAYLKDSQGQHVSLFGDKLKKTFQYVQIAMFGMKQKVRKLFPQNLQIKFQFKIHKLNNLN